MEKLKNAKLFEAVIGDSAVCTDPKSLIYIAQALVFWMMKAVLLMAQIERIEPSSF